MTEIDFSRMTRQQRIDVIDSSRTPRGAWTRATLNRFGVPWPPPRGWKRQLIQNPTKKPQ